MNDETVTVHFARCDECIKGHHFDPPRWHTWASDQDRMHAHDTGQPDPANSTCGCQCAEAARTRAT